MITSSFKITSSEFIISSATGKQPVEDSMRQVVFAGKSNVGKSSLINSLLNRKSLAKTGGTPGKTRLINFFLVNSHFYFVDLPGYGYASVSNTEKEKWRKMVKEYFSGSQDIALAFTILDIRRDPDDNDLKLIEMLDGLNIPQVILLNKKDKLSGNGLFVRMKFFDEFFRKYPSISDIIPYSTVNHFNREKVLELIDAATSGGQDDPDRL